MCAHIFLYPTSVDRRRPVVAGRPGFKDWPKESGSMSEAVCAAQCHRGNSERLPWRCVIMHKRTFQICRTSSMKTIGARPAGSALNHLDSKEAMCLAFKLESWKRPGSDIFFGPASFTRWMVVIVTVFSPLLNPYLSGLHCLLCI